MKNRLTPDALRRRHERLRSRLAKTGWVLQGTITQRYDRRVAPGRPPRGPYPQWTFKRNGKTVTVNLSIAQARAYQRAIEENRRLVTLLAELRALSRQFLDATSPSVKRRNSKANGELQR
ncbi:MAG TPA: hypothetical protein PK689_04095 [Kiritimatiellia bacterium]|nr:hypothetical protein [Kiritimatiellia bacterium]